MNCQKLPATLTLTTLALVGCGDGDDDNRKNLTVSADLANITALTMKSDRFDPDTCHTIKTVRNLEGANPSLSNALSASNHNMCGVSEYVTTDTHLVIRGLFVDLETPDGVHPHCEVVVAPLNQTSDSVKCIVENPNNAALSNVVRSISLAFDGQTIVLSREQLAEEGSRTFGMDTWHAESGLTNIWKQTYNSSDIPDDFLGVARTGYTYNGDHMYLDMLYYIAPLTYVNSNGVSKEYNSDLSSWYDTSQAAWHNYLEQDGLVFTSNMLKPDDPDNFHHQGGLLIDSQSHPVGNTDAIKLTPMRITMQNGQKESNRSLSMLKMSLYNEEDALIHHNDEGTLFARAEGIHLLRHGALLDATQGDRVVDVERILSFTSAGMPKWHAWIDVNVAGGRYLYLYGWEGDSPEPFVPDVMHRVNLDTMEYDTHNILSHELFDNMGATLKIDRIVTGLMFEITNHDDSTTMAYLNQATGEVSATPPADVTPIKNIRVQK